ncbi:MAG: hypothetical protein KKH41_01375 [Candidatus Thermoplasmatota archaeon]|nr:hypothetical protein [Euryarchaeota archaeon]MBU4032847.1 hypothetical protein [Candidatus Thermoplasmatota archaeon]MBU4145245.1 hypothetical protein [Candidatus Thermoplasmatota archaeon]MBU4591212.1 hypothetical protein [Candidatus Thermoplasmatota archaeon]
MKWRELDVQEELRKLLPQIAMYLMLGIILGFVFFYDIMPYFCVPAASDFPVWGLVSLLCVLGLVAGYLYPDIIHMLLNAIMLPLLGAVFCFLIYMSPALSPDVVATGIAEEFINMALLLMPYMVISFLTLFTVGFISMYLFEPDDV